jgi:hypothetical protein
MASEKEGREAPQAPEAVSRAGRLVVLRQFRAYAGPLSWGPWVHVGRHSGSVERHTQYQGVADTVVYGCVDYYPLGGTGQEQPEVFKDSTRITTGDVQGDIYVCFHGDPEGSAVTGRVLGYR